MIIFLLVCPNLALFLVAPSHHHSAALSSPFIIIIIIIIPSFLLPLLPTSPFHQT